MAPQFTPAQTQPNQHQTLRIADFTPGIRDNPASSYPPGTATSATNRCIGQPGGALTPLPRRYATIDGNDYLGANPASGKYLVSGFFAVSPVVIQTGTYSGNPTQLFHFVEWQDSTNHKFRVERIRLDESPVVRENLTIATDTYADTSVVPSGWGVTWGVTRANRTFDPITHPPCPPVIFFAWAPVNNAAGWNIAEFPDDQNLTSLTTYNIASPNISAQPIICCHQARVIIGEVTSYNFGPNSSFSTTENLRYTAVLDPTAAKVSAIFNFVPENPTGYNVMFSMSANELFLLKQQGAAVVTGDILDPLVTNLPMVPGTQDMHRPAPTPEGLVYASRSSGVWAWQHGDTSRHLSPYMAPDFWTLTSSEQLIANRYQFEVVDKYVLLPNNYLFDTDTKSWWRIDDPSYAAVRFWSRADRFLFGGVSSYTHSAKTAIYQWDLLTKSSAYTWTSQPFWELLDRTVTIDELILEAKGQGTIAVAIRDRTGTLQSVTFTLANTGYPERLRLNTKAVCTAPAITITADSGNTSIDAPTIYALDVNFYGGPRQPSGN